MSWILADAEWEKTWRLQPMEGDDIFDALMELDSVFTKALSVVMSGRVLLENGEQHPFLATIMETVEAGKLPTESQRNAFLRVYKHLRGLQTRGEPLRMETDDDKAKRAELSRRLVGVAQQHLDLFNDRTKSVVTSMTQQFAERGTLTAAQLALLKRIVETVPEHLFRR